MKQLAPKYLDDLQTYQLVSETSTWLDNFLLTAGETRSAWRTAFDALSGHLEDFLASFVIDDDFYRRNVAILRVYYKELVVQRVEQRLTYQTWGMIS